MLCGLGVDGETLSYLVEQKPTLMSRLANSQPATMYFCTGKVPAIFAALSECLTRQSVIRRKRFPDGSGHSIRWAGCWNFTAFPYSWNRNSLR